MRFPLVIRKKPPLKFNVFSHSLANNLARFRHNNAVFATVAMQVENPAALFTIITGHAAFIAPRRTAALNS